MADPTRRSSLSTDMLRFETNREEHLRRNATILFIQWASTAMLFFSAVWFVVTTIHWPLVGDAALMHYVVFLMDHGRAPYRDITDINLPGAYLPDWLVMHIFGVSALAWRIYDLFLLALAGLAFLKIIRPASWFAGLWAAVLFAVLHGRDGMYETGQRDLTVAVLLLCAVAVLFRGVPRRIWTSFGFGLCTGAAALIKPTALPFLLLAGPLLWDEYKSKKLIWQHISFVAAGALLPGCTALVWLAHHGALASFFLIERTLTPFHASLGRRPLESMLRHSLSPIMPIVIVWLLLLLIAPVLIALEGRPSIYNLSSSLHTVQRQTLLLGAELGMLAYILQGKDFQYHRYSLLAFLLAVIASDLDTWMRRKDLLRSMSAAVFLASSLCIGVTSAVVASRYNWKNQEFRSSLESDLARIATEIGTTTLSGKVQCLDSVFGCVSTLNDLQLLQTSGFLYDEFLFSPARVPAVDQSRALFWHAMQADPPAILIVTERLFPNGPNSYEKLNQWPAFANWMNTRYILEVERPAMHLVRQGGAAFRPRGYRIYVQSELLQPPIKNLSR